MKVKEDLIYWAKVVVIVFAAVVFWLFVFRSCEKEPGNGIDYAPYIHKFDSLQYKVDSLEVVTMRYDEQFDSINNRLNLKYAKIDSANKPELRNLFSDFRSRTN